jgi:hypothetical protein
MPKSKEPKTHFEQVPLEIVRQIAEEENSSDKNEHSRGDRGSSCKKASVFPVPGQPTVKAL